MDNSNLQNTSDEFKETNFEDLAMLVKIKEEEEELKVSSLLFY